LIMQPFLFFVNSHATLTSLTFIPLLYTCFNHVKSRKTSSQCLLCGARRPGKFYFASRTVGKLETVYSTAATSGNYP
jgi:hypothetical protein